MKILRNKPKAFAITLVLALTFSAILVTLPAVTAHEPAWEVPTYAYLVLAPDPVGVGQQVFAVFWLDWIPIGAAGIGGDRWTGLTLEITAPDNSKETKGPFVSDPIGTGYVLYTPTQVGTYQFKFSFPGQVASKYNPVNGLIGSTSRGEYINDTFLASSVEKTLTVQQDPIPAPLGFPDPTEYWTRPIEGQNTNWFKYASNWLGGGHYVMKNFQPNGIAPNSPHIMWTKPLQDGGVVGGSYPVEGQTYYTGDSYEPRFQDSIIMQGRLYYRLPLGSNNGQRGNANGGGYMCVDLRTGEEIWYSDTLGLGTAYTGSTPYYGQQYLYDSLNQHGVVGSYIWQDVGSTWIAYDALSGKWLFNETNVPSGYLVYGPTGEITQYILNYGQRWLALWNNTQHNVGLEGAMDELGGISSNAYQWQPNGKSVDMSTAYSWNVTIPDLPGQDSPQIEYVIPGELILGSSTRFNSYMEGTPDPWTMWAISLKPETRGQLLWLKNYAAPAGNTTIDVQMYQGDSESHVWLAYEVNTMMWTGYSMDTGEKLWGPVRFPGSDWDFHSRPGGGYPCHFGVGEARTIAYGNIYIAGFAGLVNCVDMKTGNLEWTYGNGGAGNSTFMGLNGPWGNYPTFISFIADGKVYTFTSEHSIGQPIYKGSKWRCIDAFTGEELWTISGYSERDMALVADGYLVDFNEFDGQIYCIGKGPSATSVSASPKIIANGGYVLIEGSVTDISSGTKQNEQAARFPHGVPAMSDESMSQWMEYVYMQKPMPMGATGVEVKLETLDPNGNFYEIDTVTSDATGMFKLMWKPPVPGEYTIIASFAGSESYWGSTTETAIGVTEAQTPGAPIEPEPTEPTEAPFITTELAIIAAVVITAIIGIVAFWALRRRK